MAWFDKNNYLVCPNCHQSEGIGLVWSGGNSHRGMHEQDFVCGFCKCEFTAIYKVVDIQIIEEGRKK